MWQKQKKKQQFSIIFFRGDDDRPRIERYLCKMYVFFVY